jgi:hypothetical protein
MSALSRTTGTTALGRQRCLRIVAGFDQRQVRTFWGRGGNDREWHKKFAKKLGQDGDAWEKHIDRVSQEMDAQRQAMMERFRAYTNKGRNAAKSDNNEGPSHTSGPDSPEFELCWWRPDLANKHDQGAGDHETAKSEAAAAPTLSEAQIKDLIQKTTKEMLDAQASDSQRRIQYLVTSLVNANIPYLKNVLDDWANRNPEWLQKLTRKLVKSETEAREENMDRMRDSLKKEVLGAISIDALATAVLQNIRRQLEDETVSIVKRTLEHGQVQSRDQLSSMIQNMMEERERSHTHIRDESIRSMIWEEIQSREHDQNASFRDMIREETNTRDQDRDGTIRRIVSDTMEQYGAVSRADMQEELAKIRQEMETSLQDEAQLLQAQIMENHDRISSADERRDADLNDSTLALMKIRDRMNAMKTEIAGTMRAIATDVFKDTTRAQKEPAQKEPAQGSSSQATSSVKSDHVEDKPPTGKLEPALDRQLADAKPDEFAASEPLPQLSYRIVHYDSNGHVHIETPKVPGESVFDSGSSTMDVGVGPWKLASIHEELKRKGYRVLCKGNNITFFGRGTSGLDAPVSGSGVCRDDRRSQCRRDVRTAVLVAMGVYIVYRVHCAFEADNEKRGKRVFKSHHVGNDVRSNKPGQDDDAWGEMFREFEKMFGMVAVR